MKLARCVQLIVVVVVEAFHSGVLDRVVHPLDLATGPRMVGLGPAVLDPVRLADHVEAHRPGDGRFRFLGCSANWMPLSVRMVWTW
jgi:hypothetical protein|tara:strand:+ start:508 stop:765 length:258 start_codon:yes stop_codon:yes gene_type:complete